MAASPSIRLAFMGTAQFACPTLQALTSLNDHRLLAVVTQPDRPKGRGLLPQASPVKQLAQSRSVPIYQPLRVRSPEFVGQLRDLNLDLIVVAAYGQILPPSILTLPSLGCLNVHASLLPRHRGAAPIQWALAEGDTQTGVTIMKMDSGLDTGEIVSLQRTAIKPEEDAQALHDRLADLGADLLLRTLPQYARGEITPQPQPEVGVTYARKITREDGHLDWRQTATVLAHRIRAFTPWPGAFTYLPHPDRPRLLKIWKAGVESQGQGEPGTVLQAEGENLRIACGEGALRVLALQLEGGRRMSPAEFLSGHSLPIGLRLVLGAAPSP